ncbi:MAG: hypothetical protein ACUVSW_05715 [Roseiflexus sp.]
MDRNARFCTALRRHEVEQGYSIIQFDGIPAMSVSDSRLRQRLSRFRQASSLFSGPCCGASSSGKIADDLDNLLPYPFDLSLFSLIGAPEVCEGVQRTGVVCYERHDDLYLNES